MFALSLLSVYYFNFYFLIWFSVTGSMSAKCPLGLRLKRALLGLVIISSLYFSCALVLESGFAQMCSAFETGVQGKTNLL